MNRRLIKNIRVVLLASMFAVTSTSVGQTPEPVSFNRDIRPILARHCYACHGPDDESREADLRLDQLAAGKYGTAIVPGKPQKSHVFQRIIATDADERMPPAEHKPLSKAQIELVKQWIQQGAKADRHWAFVPPAAVKPPRVKDTTWPRNGIDHFVLSQLEARKLRPARQADRPTIIKRVYLDLLGVPPGPDAVNQFLADRLPRAYERMVERLLASPQYGERWARPWLDLARYADTNGYEKDRPRSIWPYRDWVIQSINADKPYDQFSIEQIAGDMLPQATEAQRVATGFHRNTMLNEEGGIDPLEYRFYAMVDRVATTSTIWLGLTVGCAQCHTHKYDPVTHDDYYRLMALLNNADEPDLILSNTSSTRTATTTQITKLKRDLAQQIQNGENKMSQAWKQWIKRVQTDLRPWQVARPTTATANLPKLSVLKDGSIFSSGDITKRDEFTLTIPLEKYRQPIVAIRLEVLGDDRLPARGPGRAFYEGRKGDFFLSEVSAAIGKQAVAFSGGSESYGKISIGNGSAVAKNVFDKNGSTGWSTSGREGSANQLVLDLAKPLTAKGDLTIKMLFERHFAASLGRFRWWVLTAANSKPGTAKAVKYDTQFEQLLLTTPEQDWTPQQWELALGEFIKLSPDMAATRKRLQQIRRGLPAATVTMVMQEREPDHPRPTYRHHRGEYLSRRERVQPGVPKFLTTAAKPTNRLELAQWLLSSENPLSARVAVNRAWREFFGVGIVRTNGDFGTQSTTPTHPQLLDWLANELMHRRWSLKDLHRLIVTSATYRQSSQASPHTDKLDPENRWLSRATRRRVEAEMVRDLFLVAAGQISYKIGGPSVYPPQPASVTQLAYGSTRWPISKGEDRYRRSLYTFSKRTAPFAAFSVFDAPSGENCIARRDRSNTPLQALTILNDEMFLELARAMAKRAIREQATVGPRAVLESMFRRILVRPPEPDELDALLGYYRQQYSRLTSATPTAGFDASKIAAAKKAPEVNQLAAWTLVARVLMNLDEAITRE